MNRLLEQVAAIFFPPACVLCGELVEPGELWCGRCGLPRLEETSVPGGCPCLSGVAAPYLYRETVARALVDLKARRNDRATCFFARSMARALEEQLTGAVFHVLAPVPQNRRNLRERGYDNVRLLAEALGELTGLPVRTDLLVRHEDSLVQHTLSARDRRENARNSYQGGQGRLEQGETVLLVDDILTTGSTADTCAARLLEAGAGRVYGVAAAMTLMQAEGKEG